VDVSKTIPQQLAGVADAQVGFQTCSILNRHIFQGLKDVSEAICHVHDCRPIILTQYLGAGLVLHLLKAATTGSLHLSNLIVNGELLRVLGLRMKMRANVSVNGILSKRRCYALGSDEDVEEGSKLRKCIKL
jgi:hypothetical protein